MQMKMWSEKVYLSIPKQPVYVIGSLLDAIYFSTAHHQGMLYGPFWCPFGYQCQTYTLQSRKGMYKRQYPRKYNDSRKIIEVKHG